MFNPFQTSEVTEYIPGFYRLTVTKDGTFHGAFLCESRHALETLRKAYLAFVPTEVQANG